MIDYAELVHALHDWRVRQGLPVGSGLPIATPPPPAHAIKVAAPAPPPPRPGAGRPTAPPPMRPGGATAGSGRMPTAELLSDEDALVEDAIEPDAYDAQAGADAHGATQGYPAQADIADEDYNDATTAGASLDDQGGLVESVAFAPFGAEPTAAGSLDEMRPYDGGFDAPGHTRLGHKPASARALVDDDPLAGGDDDDKTRG